MAKEYKRASELMPKNEASLRILQERAEQLARIDLDKHRNQGISYVKFRIGKNECYGISYEYVHEILQKGTLFKPPCTPDCVAGVINWRGKLITVVDLMTFFHPKQTRCDNEFIIVTNTNDIALGILASHVDGSETYDLVELKSPLSSVNVANPEYILGLHQSTIAILNLEKLLAGLGQEIKEEVYKTGEVHGHSN